jgi:hypothetical protein
VPWIRDGDGKKSGSGMYIPDKVVFQRVKKQFLRLKIKIRIWDPGGSGMEKFGFGIRDKHPGSATLRKSKTFVSWPL